MCKKFRVFFVALVTMCCIAVCGGFSLVSSAVGEITTTSDFIGPINTTTTTTVDYSEDGPLGWIGSQIQKLGTAISDAFQKVGDYILNGIKSIFVPDAGYLDEKFNAIKERFDFAESISDTVQVIVNWFENVSLLEPPVVTVHFSNGKSAHGVDYGTSGKILDFSWYAPYKPAVDIIFSAFLWLFFIWRIYLALPNIIAGVAPQAVFDTWYAASEDELNVEGLTRGMYQNHGIDNSERSYRANRASRYMNKR